MAPWRPCRAPVSGWLHYADHGVAPMCRSRAGALHPSGARRFIPAGVGNTCPSLFIPPSRSDLSTGANGWPAVWPGCDAVEKRAAEKAAVQAAFISTCFFEFYLFRRFSSTIARTRAIFHTPRRLRHAPRHLRGTPRQLRRPPRSSSGWKNSFGDMAGGFLDVIGDLFPMIKRSPPGVIEVLPRAAGPYPPPST